MNKRIFALVCLIAAALTVLLFGCDSPQATSDKTGSGVGESSYKTTKDLAEVTYDLQGHRGGRDARPENTMYSYLYAIETGCSTIECDMHLLADGNIVLGHNPVLNPAFAQRADGTYVSASEDLDIRTMTLDQVKQYSVAKMNPEIDPEYYDLHGKTQVTPDSAQMPTIDELFGMVRDMGYPVCVSVESKLSPEGPESTNDVNPRKFVEAFYAKVVEYGMQEHVVLQSFDVRSLVAMKKIDPSIKTSFLFSQELDWGVGGDTIQRSKPGASPWLAGYDIDDYQGDCVKLAEELGVDYISPYFKEIDMNMVERAHQAGIKVMPWTVNSADAAAALYAMGVDGMISDCPWIVREYLLQQGETLRAQSDLSGSAYGQYHLDPDHVQDDTADRNVGGASAR